MIDGQIKITQSDYNWHVESDIVTGQMQTVGWVWWETDHSVEAKKHYPKLIKQWFARPFKTKAQLGPFKTRKLAAQSLVADVAFWQEYR